MDGMNRSDAAQGGQGIAQDRLGTANLHDLPPATKHDKHCCSNNQNLVLITVDPMIEVLKKVEVIIIILIKY
jgi:hypothetical protein